MSTITVNKEEFQSIVADSAAMIGKYAELRETSESLQKQAADATAEAARFRKESEDLRKQAEDKKIELKETVTKVANLWVDRGLLTAGKRDELVDLVIANPAQGIDAMNKIAMNAGAVENGKADPNAAMSFGPKKADDIFAARVLGLPIDGE